MLSNRNIFAELMGLHGDRTEEIMARLSREKAEIGERTGIIWILNSILEYSHCLNGIFANPHLANIASQLFMSQFTRKQ